MLSYMQTRVSYRVLQEFIILILKLPLDSSS